MLDEWLLAAVEGNMQYQLQAVQNAYYCDQLSIHFQETQPYPITTQLAPCVSQRAQLHPVVVWSYPPVHLYLEGG